MELGIWAAHQWALGWQVGEWALANLPNELGMRVVVYPGGSAVLGIALVSDETIVINEVARDTPALYLATLTHEGSHVLAARMEGLPVRQPLLPLCSTRWAPIASEMLAWTIAGRLAVSREQDRLITYGRAGLCEVARHNGVPPELVQVGRAVHRRVECWPLRATGADDGNLSLGYALGMWAAKLQALTAVLNPKHRTT